MNEIPDDVEVLAAGAVLWRSAADRVEVAAPRSPGSPAPDPSGGSAEGSRLTVAVVHRPKYDDWSLPKGKLKHHESMPAGAVREIEEETGVTARLGPFLCDVRYIDPDGRPKLVRYWSGQECADGGFTPNDEVDEVRWVSPDGARELLSYPLDREVLERFAALGPPSSLLVLVRHAKAGSRDGWDDDDLLRPLSEAGVEQAQDLAGLLRLFGPDRIAAAPPLRCRDTVAPLADAVGLPVTDEPLLGEDSYGGDPDATMARVRELAALPGVTVVCSQGGVIPDAVALLARDAALAVPVDPDDVPAKKASVWVLGSHRGALVSADYVKHPRG